MAKRKTAEQKRREIEAISGKDETARVQAILAELEAACPQGFAAMRRGICPHSFGLRDTLRGKCLEWDAGFEPPFCAACWRAAMEGK